MSLAAALTGIAGLRASSFYAVTGNAKRHTQSGVPFRLERSFGRYSAGPLTPGLGIGE